MILFSTSRILALAARICRLMLASSLLAASAISSSPTMERVIFSSRNLLGIRAPNRPVRHPASSPAQPFSWRAARRTPAISSSSRVFSIPPSLARARLPLTGRISHRGAVPFSATMRLASVVSRSRSATSVSISDGRSSSAASLAAEHTASSWSIRSTLGNSRVRRDFS